jgi:hypothetical protein
MRVGRITFSPELKENLAERQKTVGALRDWQAVLKGQPWRSMSTLKQTAKNEEIMVGWEDEIQIVNVAEAIEARDKMSGPPLGWMPLPPFPKKK